MVFQKLLRNLQSDGYVFPGFENNPACESKKQEHVSLFFCNLIKNYMVLYIFFELLTRVSVLLPSHYVERVM